MIFLDSLYLKLLIVLDCKDRHKSLKWGFKMSVSATIYCQVLLTRGSSSKIFCLVFNDKVLQWHLVATQILNPNVFFPWLGHSSSSFLKLFPIKYINLPIKWHTVINARSLCVSSVDHIFTQSTLSQKDKTWWNQPWAELTKSQLIWSLSLHNRPHNSLPFRLER